MELKIKSKKLIIGFSMLVIIIGTAIAVKQHPFMTLPLCVSVFIMLLQAGVNRYSFLAGGINSMIYAAVYFKMGIPASGWYALLFSFPLQVITFLNWKKRAYKHSVVLKSLSAKAKIIIIASFAVLWSAIFYVLYLKGNPYAILDTTSSLLGTLVTFLSMFAFREYPYVSLVSGIISITLNVQICTNDFSQLPYLFYSVYSYICIVISVININKLYKEQREVEVKQ